MRKTISADELIKTQCRLDFIWDNENNKWTIKIKHLSKTNPYSSVRVTMEGFENFQTAYIEATNLFKRNIKNQIKEQQTITAKFSSDDIWPEYIS